MPGNTQSQKLVIWRCQFFEFSGLIIGFKTVPCRVAVIITLVLHQKRHMLVCSCFSLTLLTLEAVARSSRYPTHTNLKPLLSGGISSTISRGPFSHTASLYCFHQPVLCKRVLAYMRQHPTKWISVAYNGPGHHCILPCLHCRQQITRNCFPTTALVAFCFFRMYKQSHSPMTRWRLVFFWAA